MSKDAYLNKILTEEAKQKEKFMQGKVYAYKLYKGVLLDELAKKGKCKVLSREYERDIDCDMLLVVDINTNEKLYANQFALELKEV